MVTRITRASGVNDKEMSFETPASLIAGLVNARNNGDIDLVVACYELVPDDCSKSW